MKKILAMLLAVCMVLALAACGGSAKPAETTAPTATEAPATEAPAETEAAAEEVTVLTHAEYAAIEVEANELVPVVVETYVQATQSWWNDSITVYAQSEDGAYFIYGMACSEEDAAKLVPGTKIRVTGDKTVWSGEYEITNATFEFLDGEFIAEPADLTALLGTDELLAHQNEKVSLKGLVVAPSTAKDSTEEAAFLYNWDGSGAAGNNNDLYFNVTDGSTRSYTFTVESYLCGEGTDVYNTVTNLKVGDIIDLEGFLYWYEGAQPHITSVTVVG